MIGRARVDATSGRNDAASRVDARPVGSIGRLGSVRARPNRCGRPIDATTGPNDWAPESIRTRPQSTRPLATIGASPNRKIGLLIGTPSKQLGRAQLIGAGPRQCESPAIAKVAVLCDHICGRFAGAFGVAHVWLVGGSPSQVSCESSVQVAWILRNSIAPDRPRERADRVEQIVSR